MTAFYVLLVKDRLARARCISVLEEARTEEHEKFARDLEVFAETYGIPDQSAEVEYLWQQAEIRKRLEKEEAKRKAFGEPELDEDILPF